MRKRTRRLAIAACAAWAISSTVTGAPQGEEMDRKQHDKRVDYVEIPVTSLDEAEAFYGGVFGWSFQDWGPEYRSFNDGRLDGGFRPVDEVVRGGPLVIMYAVDLEAVAAAVEEYGGTIEVPIFSFPGGRRFQFLDPFGNELAVWTDQGMEEEE